MKNLLWALFFLIICFLALDQYYEYMLDVNFHIDALKAFGGFGYWVVIGGPVFFLSLIPVYFFGSEAIFLC